MLATVFSLPATAFGDGVTSDATTSGLGVGFKKVLSSVRIIKGLTSEHVPGVDPKDLPPFYFTSKAVEGGGGYNCTDLGGGGQNCSIPAGQCQGGVNYSTATGDFVAQRTGGNRGTSGTDMVTVARERVERATGNRQFLGYGCQERGQVGSNTAQPTAAPIVITVTREDFAKLPVEPAVAHAGPSDGWLPAGMPNVLHAESEPQVLDTTLLNTPVSVRATAQSYHWDLGDGNTIDTEKPGKPYPSEEISSTYAYEGWYDVTLTTTFTGEFSVNGGEWQPIDGTIEVESEPIAIYSKSLESRLVDGDKAPDENEDPWKPGRSSATDGPQDPEATHRRL